MVDHEFVIQSSRQGDRLRIWTVRPRYRWRARLEFGDLTAETTVHERYSRDVLALDSWFADLADAWRGWSGTREWKALGLALAAQHDGLGHVRLDAALDHAHLEADRWTVRASLLLDAGTLDRAARDARVLDAVG